MSEKRPNDDLFNGASQTRTPNEIADGKGGKYNDPCPPRGNTPPPGERQPPFTIKGA